MEFFFLRNVQEIILLLQSAENHYYDHINPQLEPILSQFNPVHTLSSHFSKIHVNLTLSSMHK
jgi:hypothetical protein